MTDIIDLIKQVANFFAGQLTAKEWLAILEAVVISWLVTHVVKRSVTWKNNKRRPLVTCVYTKRLRIRIKWPIFIAFIAAFLVASVNWPDTGMVGGRHVYFLAAIVGGSSPFIYFLAIHILIWILKKSGMEAAALRVQGERRLMNDDPPSGQERRK